VFLQGSNSLSLGGYSMLENQHLVGCVGGCVDLAANIV